MSANLTELLFIVSIVIIVYAYGGYALLLRVFKLQRKTPRHQYLPALSILIPVFNEEKVIEAKIKNCLQLNYPADKLTLIVVDDGSTDNTASIARSFAEVQLVQHEKRAGKTAALNSGMQQVKTPVVVFTDATAVIGKDCLLQLCRHYENEKIGGVSAEKKIARLPAASPVTEAEDIYWQYESFLKQTDSDFYSVVGADGALFSIRSSLFQPLDTSLILDDFFISVNVCLQGYQFIYEKTAIATEPATSTVHEEQKRKIRISAGCFQALKVYRQLLNPFSNFRLFLIYFSHRVLRWTACPLLLPVLYVANLVLFIQHAHMVYDMLFIGQTIFYLLAFIGWLSTKSGIRHRFLLIPYYFVFMNVSLYRGFFRYIYNRQSVLWEKTER